MAINELHIEENVNKTTISGNLHYREEKRVVNIGRETSNKARFSIKTLFVKNEK